MTAQESRAYTCIKPQCHPHKCDGCNCAIAPDDEAAHIVLELLNTFAVCGHGHTFEDGDSAIVDRARAWLQSSRRAQSVARTPLSANEVSGLLESAGYWPGDSSRADFINGLRYGEQAHGITQEKQG